MYYLFLKVDVSKDLKLLNGQKALVDLRLCIQYKNIIASILAIYVNNETIFLGVGKKDSNYQNLLFNMTIKDEELMEKEQQVKSSSMENDEFDENDEDDEIDIEDVCPVVSTASAPITTIQQEDELEGKSDFYMNFLIPFTIKVIISTASDSEVNNEIWGLRTGSISLFHYNIFNHLI